MDKTRKSRDRVLAAIRREPHDHVPLSMHMPQGPWFPPPFYWRNQFERARKQLDMGLDPVIDLWLPDPQPSPEVEIRTWREQKGDEWILTKEFHTPAGVLRQVVKETEGWCEPEHAPWIPTTFGSESRTHYNMDLFDDHAVSRRLEPWVKGREDLAKLRYLIRPVDGFQLDEWRMDAQRALAIARRLGVLTQCRRTIVTDANEWMCDIPWFMMQLYEDPGFIVEFLQIFMDWSLAMVDLALETDVDLIQYRGWYDIPNFWGPKFWKQHICPIIEKQAQRIHTADRYMSYLLTEGHGQYTELFKNSGVDVLYAIDPRMVKGVGVAGLGRELAGCKCFWGGVNNEVTLQSGSPVRIEQEVADSIRHLNVNNGLILSALVDIHTKVDAIQALIDAWRKHG